MHRRAYISKPYIASTSTKPVLPSNLDSLLAVVDTSLVFNYLLIMSKQWEALFHYGTNIIDSFSNDVTVRLIHYHRAWTNKLQKD